MWAQNLPRKQSDVVNEVPPPLEVVGDLGAIEVVVGSLPQLREIGRRRDVVVHFHQRLAHHQSQPDDLRLPKKVIGVIGLF